MNSEPIACKSVPSGAGTVSAPAKSAPGRPGTGGASKRFGARKAGKAAVVAGAVTADVAVATAGAAVTADVAVATAGAAVALDVAEAAAITATNATETAEAAENAEAAEIAAELCPVLPAAAGGVRTGLRVLFYRAAKRAGDVCGALLLLFLLALPMLLIALAIRIEAGAPVLFFQRRTGRGGRSFVCCKFRTMHTCAPPDCKSAELAHPERFITRTGAFLRRTSLDELPQLFNVLTGSMSLVGPRPVVLTETRLIALRRARGADTVKPGLTGLAQISGRDLVEDERKAELDAEYVRRASVLTDLGILFRTVRYVLTQKDIREGKGAGES